MEKVEAPECRPLHRRYDSDRTFPDYFRVDAKRNSDDVREEMPAREPDRPGESSLCECTRPVTSSSQAVGCGRGPQLPSRELYNTRRFERGKCFARLFRLH